MKLERMLAIVMLLLNREHINARALAEHFEVSQRTIYRDIEAISRSGIPVVSYMGAEGGFGIMENYRIGKNFLNADEISSLVTALSNLNRTVNSQRVSNTLEKLEGMLSGKRLDATCTRGFPIKIDYSSWSSNKTEKDKPKVLNKAIDEKRIVEFNYIDAKGGSTHRLVEPLSLILKDFAWYLHGYCQLREDYRLFKVKRMHSLKMTMDSFTRDPLPIEGLDYHEEWNKDKPVLNVVLRFTRNVRTRVVDYFNEEQIQFDADGTTTVSFALPEDDWLFELVLGFGSQVEVLEPPHLRNLIKQKAAEMVSIYTMDEESRQV